MSNIADLIEAYILRQLAAQQDGTVELRRTDIADKISCVLSTRFTPAKGFNVESRRGLGGYIRIVQVPDSNMVYQEILEKMDEDTPIAAVQNAVHYLLQHEMITTREASLMMQFVTGLYNSPTLADEERVHLLKAMFMTLANLS